MDVSVKLTDYFQTEKNLTVRSIEDYLNNLTITKSDLTPYVVPPKHLEYGRHTVFKNKRVEVCVLNWVKGSKSCLHDHANSDCTMLVVHGKLLNKNYSLDEKNQVISQLDINHKDDVVSISKSDIHQLEQTGDEETITLHVYYPPIENNKVFNDPEEFSRLKCD